MPGPIIRKQKLFVIQRKSTKLYWQGDSSWHGKLALARVLPEMQAKSAVQIDIGLNPEDFELLEVVPILKSKAEKFD